MPPKRASRSFKSANATSKNAPPPPSSTSTGRSVLGGMAGGYRVDPDNPQNETHCTIEDFTIPYKDKAIVCQRYLAAVTGTSEDQHSNAGKKRKCSTADAEEPQQLIFTHGAGGGISNPATSDFAAGCAQISPVLVFQGTMNLKSRIDTFRTVAEHQNWSRALGGRSMGARAAVIAANEMPSTSPQTQALVLVSYPLDNGKGEIRDEILKNISADIDVLFVSGDRDRMCDLTKLHEVRAQMQAKSWLLVVGGADHGMSLGKGPATEAVRNASGRATAIWLTSRSALDAVGSVRWDQERGQVVSDWLEDPSLYESFPRQQTRSRKSRDCNTAKSQKRRKT